MRANNVYRLCCGVVYFCGVRLDLELGVEACWVFRRLLGVFGSSPSLLSSHYRGQRTHRTIRSRRTDINSFLLWIVFFPLPLPRRLCLIFYSLN